MHTIIPSTDEIFVIDSCMKKTYNSLILCIFAKMIYIYINILYIYIYICMYIVTFSNKDLIITAIIFPIFMYDGH